MKSVTSASIESELPEAMLTIDVVISLQLVEEAEEMVRFVLRNDQWERLAPLLPGKAADEEGPCADDDT